MATTTRSQRPAGSGWFTFAGVMFGLAGFSDLLWGIGALDSQQYLPEEGLLASNLSSGAGSRSSWASPP